ncbi:hypothetical protein HMPREF9372_3265 [Sporosarcina newyorkensis 2681]|uniref:Uncharacterized protein n=1 Tax=Sporosarcina newyorkensis 2681 TaxID=1027292 RepID=F9DWT4_9BACL|nr:hypothetical protein HMPREF9372_3265 [Sporosarcina newyorkensis 2681]
MEEYDAIANELSKLNAQSVALYDSKGTIQLIVRDFFSKSG